jgi:hypothetical protein
MTLRTAFSGKLADWEEPFPDEKQLFKHFKELKLLHHRH